MQKLNLKIEIDKNSGFCFGVIFAIQKAEEVLNKQKKLFCLGDIVHNEEENERLKNKGMIVISRSDLHNIFNETILFRAHGEPPESYELARKNGNTIVDASCPTILKIQERIKKSYQNGEKIYLYGQHNHPEIIGLNGQINNTGVVFENYEELDLNTLPKKITLYSQTTKSLEKFHEIAESLKQNGFNVIIHDTICRQVSNRQDNIRKFCASFDKILFVAGKASSNGKILYNICKQGNDLVYFISKPDEIIKDWFLPNETVGICGATSTPRWLMEDVKNELDKL